MGNDTRVGVFEKATKYAMFLGKFNVARFHEFLEHNQRTMMRKASNEIALKKDEILKDNYRSMHRL